MHVSEDFPVHGKSFSIVGPSFFFLAMFDQCVAQNVWSSELVSLSVSKTCSRIESFVIYHVYEELLNQAFKPETGFLSFFFFIASRALLYTYSASMIHFSH